jgi:hypothetical protein
MAVPGRDTSEERGSQHDPRRVRPVTTATGEDARHGRRVRPVAGTTVHRPPGASCDPRSLPAGSRPVIVATRCTLGSPEVRCTLGSPEGRCTDAQDCPSRALRRPRPFPGPGRQPPDPARRMGCFRREGTSTPTAATCRVVRSTQRSGRRPRAARPGAGRRPSGCDPAVGASAPCGPVPMGGPGAYLSLGGRTRPGPVTSASPSTGTVPSGEVTT